MTARKHIAYLNSAIAATFDNYYILHVRDCKLLGNFDTNLTIDFIG